MSSLGTSSSSATLDPDKKNPAPKRKTKSRNGCITCKRRRLKCDETKPACFNCTKKNIECAGYATRFKWKSFNDSKESSLPSHESELSSGKRSAMYRDTGSLNNVSDPSLHINSSSSNSTHALENMSSTSMRPHSISLKDHIELTSLSVLGKSTKDIKLENRLIAKGLNPKSYLDSEEVARVQGHKKMSRSYSTQDVSYTNYSEPLQRSQSMSTPQSHSEISSFRNEIRNNTGLHSLAEAAVDEMRSRSPDTNMSNAMAHNDHMSLHSFTFKDEMSPKITLLNGTPKEWNQNHAPASPSVITTPAGKDPSMDLNLTPSLSALISYVFTNEDHQRKQSESSVTSHENLQMSAMSPLDLSSFSQSQSPSQELKETGFTDFAINDATFNPNFGQDKTPSVLLSHVGNRLIKYESQSPSIVKGSSVLSLLKTSEQEQILYLYSTYTCGIMSIKSGTSENPWRNIYLPLATEYSYLFNSIASMTLFHLAGNSKLSESSASLRSKGYFYMKRCIFELATGLSRADTDSSNQLPADVALATCLNLAVSESWDTHTSSGIAHLKGAKSMIQKVLTIIKQYYTCSKKQHGDKAKTSGLRGRLALVGDDEWEKIEEQCDDIDERDQVQGGFCGLYIPKNLQLLFNEWIYFEVLSQMTSYNGHDDKGIDLVATITKFMQTTHKKSEGSKSSKSSDKNESPTDSQHSASSGVIPGQGTQSNFFDNLDTMLQNNDYVDPLLGCAQSLFSIMGKVANLISKVRKDQESGERSKRNNLSNISLASELKRQLTDWKPNITNHFAEMMNQEGSESTWDLYSCVSTAEAYRYATLLYLHEAVPEVPSLSSHQLAEKIFVLLASIPSSSNLYIIHIFPLLVSSCEANTGEEREWCEARWALLIDRIWIGNIDRAFEVVKEVWRRKDEHKRFMRKDAEERKVVEKLTFENPGNVSTHLQEMVAAMRTDSLTEEKGITSKLHWSSVMREWGWEVLLA